MRANVRHALDVIEDVLLSGGRDALDLMGILSAVRGPDVDDDRLKQTTTAPLRSMIFPRLWEKARGDYVFPIGIWNMSDPSSYIEPIATGFAAGHFNNHVLIAKEAIDRVD